MPPLVNFLVHLRRHFTFLQPTFSDPAYRRKLSCSKPPPSPPLSPPPHPLHRFPLLPPTLSFGLCGSPFAGLSRLGFGAWDWGLGSSSFPLLQLCNWR